MCVCPHVGVHVHAVFKEGLSQRGLLYHRTLKSLNMTFQFIKVFQPPAPRNFSLATFPPQVPVTCQPAQSHLPLLPSLFLTFLPVHTSGSHSPQLFMLNGLAVTQHPLCIPYSLSPFPFRSHICVLYYLFWSSAGNKAGQRKLRLVLWRPGSCHFTDLWGPKRAEVGGPPRWWSSGVTALGSLAQLAALLLLEILLPEPRLKGC